ncbi:MAG: hypothetical protein WCE21_00945 [Candidatus Babeliales bacterium]
MYKKITLLSALLCTGIQYASDITPRFKIEPPLLEIKPSYFFFWASPMKKIYNKGGFEIQCSASAPFCNYVDLYGSVGYRTVRGHALNSGERTSLTVIPVDIGLKPVFNFCNRFYYFFAIGPRYFHFDQHNKSPYVDRTVKGNFIGLFLNTGFNVLLANCLSFGIFGEYSYEKNKVHPKMVNVYSNGNVQIGGLAFGGSVGYAF